MEQDDRDNQDILRGADNPDAEVDFEAYLREKEKSWTKPVSELSIHKTPTVEGPKSAETNGAPGAEDSSSPEHESETDVDESRILRHGAPHAESLGTKLERREIPAPFPRVYVVEQQVEMHIDDTFLEIKKAVYENPDQWKQIFIDRIVKPLFSGLDANGDQRDVTKLDAEGIYHVYHGMETCIFYIRAMQGVLRNNVLEEFLKAETAQKRMELLEMDRKFKVGHTSKAKGEKKTSSGKKAVGKSSKGGSEAIKAIKTLHGLMMDRPAIETALKGRNLLTDEAVAYLGKLFG
jgi:hypothetical protein